MKRYVRAILACVGAIALFQFVSSIVTSIALLFNMNPFAYLASNNPSTYALGVKETSILTMIVDILIILLVIYVFQNHPIEESKIHTFKIKKLAVIIPLGIGLVLLGSIVSSVGNSLFFKDTSVVKMFNTMTTPLELFGICVVAPIAEEFLFRGLLFNYLRKNVNIVVAIFLQAATFGFAHGNGFQGVYAFILGIFLALVYMYTGSIFGDIILHALANSYSSLVNPFLENIFSNLGGRYSGSIIICYFIYFGIAMILLAVFFYRIQTKRQGKLLLVPFACLIGFFIFTIGYSTAKNKLSVQNNKPIIEKKISTSH